MKTKIYCITRLRLATAWLAALLLCGCANSLTTGTRQLTRSFVEQNLVNGRTTKAEVRAMLGEPQATSSGNLAGKPDVAEIWTYTKTFYRDAAEKGIGYAIALGMVNPYGSGYDRVEVSVLMVSFNARGHVMGHNFSTAAAGAPR